MCALLVCTYTGPQAEAVACKLRQNRCLICISIAMDNHFKVAGAGGSRLVGAGTPKLLLFNSSTLSPAQTEYRHHDALEKVTPTAINGVILRHAACNSCCTCLSG